MPDFTIRAAVRSDLAGLIALEAASFGSDRLSERSFRRLVAAPSAACRVARAGDGLAGYHLVLFRRNAAVARLYSIAVDPRARGRGLATALLADAERVARRRGCRALRLEVRADNRQAVRLYERQGYRPIGRYASYYADKADAIRYEKPLARTASAAREPDEDRSPRDVLASAPRMKIAVLRETAVAPSATAVGLFR